MSLDRLIDLAKRTGDRLIVHDPLRGRDVVIMDIDAYERLLDSSAHFDEEVGGRGAGRSAVWPDDDAPWHRAGSILEDRYREEFRNFVDKRAETPPSSANTAPEETWDTPTDRGAEEPPAPTHESLSEAPQDVPRESNPPPAGSVEKDAGDEPIFYEEPIV